MTDFVFTDDFTVADEVKKGFKENGYIILRY